MGSDITSCGFSGGSGRAKSTVKLEDPGLMPGEGVCTPVFLSGNSTWMKKPGELCL